METIEEDMKVYVDDVQVPLEKVQRILRETIGHGYLFADLLEKAVAVEAEICFFTEGYAIYLRHKDTMILSDPPALRGESV